MKRNINILFLTLIFGFFLGKGQTIINLELPEPCQSVSFLITSSSSPEVGGVTTGDGSYIQGSTATLKAVPSYGYVFKNWLENGVVVSTNPNYSFSVSKNRILSAKFIIDSSLSFSIVTKSSPVVGGATTGDGEYGYNKSVTVKAFPANDYVFDSWLEGTNVVATTKNYNFTVTGNRTLKAKFVKAQYNVITSSKPDIGGTTTGDGLYVVGKNVTVKAVPNPGYKFENWTQGSTVLTTNSTYSFTVVKNINLKANFSKIKYIIEVNSNPEIGGTVSGGGNYYYQNNVTVKAVPKPGYLFKNWKIGNSIVSTDKNYSFQVTENRTLTATFVEGFTITATVAPAEGGTITGDGEYETGKTAKLIASPNTDFVFEGWYEGSTVVATTLKYNFPVTSNRKLKAKFVKARYTINTKSNPPEGGETSGGGEFIVGKNITVKAVPNPGYIFESWKEGTTVVSTTKKYSFTISGNRTLKAVFKPDPTLFTITSTASPVIGGVTSGNGSFKGGTTVTLTAIPNPGYLFKNWQEDGVVVSTNSTYSFVVSSNRNLIAKFKVDDTPIYTVVTKSNPSAGGTTTGAGDYQQGSAVTVKAIPSPGYVFQSWKEGNTVVATTKKYTFTITDNRTLKAVFSLGSSLINVTPNFSEAGIISGDGEYDRGGLVTLNATTNSGYDFMGWMEGDKLLSTSSQYSFLADNDRNITAYYKKTVPDKTDVIMFYPNPFDDFITIDPGNNPIKQIEFFDNSGRLIYSKRVDSDTNFKIDTRNLKTGSYLLKVTTDNRIKTFKVLKK